MYCVYHGPEGLKNIASRVHTATLLLAKGTACIQETIIKTNNNFTCIKIYFLLLNFYRNNFHFQVCQLVVTVLLMVLYLIHSELQSKEMQRKY